eukprot:GHRQ01025420.1.p1 GENE.GHRQ01025420.1~~GHRQ01025420.1.p1  ORF type:complete len:196 (+),score=13.76 GHRQ01025420.1:890-1477(+)
MCSSSRGSTDHTCVLMPQYCVRIVESSGYHLQAIAQCSSRSPFTSAPAAASVRLGSRRASQDVAGCSRRTTMTVMLSHPTPRAALGSPARHASSSAQAASAGLSPAANLFEMKSTHSWLLITSHTPSQASRKKLSSGLRLMRRTSGCAVMIWSFAGSSTLPLYLRSPMARLRLRLPFTRHTPPISLRKPPGVGLG